jgi:DNA-binding IclR family transcriptional regulator
LVDRLSRLLEVLGDGNWHETDQLCLLIGLSDSEVQRIMDFLEKYDFAEVDEAKRHLRISKDFKRILAQNT